MLSEQQPITTSASPLLQILALPSIELTPKVTEAILVGIEQSGEEAARAVIRAVPRMTVASFAQNEPRRLAEILLQAVGDGVVDMLVHWQPSLLDTPFAQASYRVETMQEAEWFASVLLEWIKKPTVYGWDIDITLGTYLVHNPEFLKPILQKIASGGAKLSLTRTTKLFLDAQQGAHLLACSKELAQTSPSKQEIFTMLVEVAKTDADWQQALQYLTFSGDVRAFTYDTKALFERVSSERVRPMLEVLCKTISKKDLSDQVVSTGILRMPVEEVPLFIQQASLEVFTHILSSIDELKEGASHVQADLVKAYVDAVLASPHLFKVSLPELKTWMYHFSRMLCAQDVRSIATVCRVSILHQSVLPSEELLRAWFHLPQALTPEEADACLQELTARRFVCDEPLFVALLLKFASVAKRHRFLMNEMKRAVSSDFVRKQVYTLLAESHLPEFAYTFFRNKSSLYKDTSSLKYDDDYKELRRVCWTQLSWKERFFVMILG